MEYSDIKKLIEDMGNSKLTSLDIEFPEGTKIKMEKKEESIVIKEVSENINKNNLETNLSLNTVQNSIKVNENNNNVIEEGKIIK